MALHTKTVEYACQGVVGPQTAATLLTFSTLTLTIPETTSRTFRSVTLVLTYLPSRTTSTSSTTQPTASVQLGAATPASFSIGIDTGNGVTYTDMRHFEHWLDCTSHFTSNFGSGATQTLVVTFQSPVATQNISAKIIITYEWDDADDTRAKTVRIPLEGNGAVLTGTLTNIGSSTEIPDLSSFLPESSVSIKDVFFEIQFSTRNMGTNTVNSVALDAEAATNLGTVHTGGTTSGDCGSFRFVWKRTDMTTNATHNFKASSNQTNAAYEVAVVLVVTYTYTHSTSTTILNSIIVPFDILASGMQDLTASTKQIMYSAEFWVEEPGTITMVQSAIRVNTGYGRSDNAGDDFKLKAGSQASFATYTSPMRGGFVSPNGTAGIPLQLRCDSGSTGGSGLSIARGKNLMTFALYANGTFQSTYNFCLVNNAVFYLNYTSSKHASGDGVHNRSIFWLGQTDVFNGVLQETSVTGFPIAESSWATSGFCPVVKTNEFDGVEVRFQFQSGEGLSGGWGTVTDYVLPNFSTRYDSEHGTYRLKWGRYSGDLDTSRANPLATRPYRFSGSPVTGISYALAFWFTYHAITFSVQGTVRGYTGGGSGITVDIHRTDTGERIATATTGSGGTFSATVYDNTINLYTEAYQDGTQLGRSANGVAS